MFIIGEFKEREEENLAHSVTNSKIIFVLNDSNQLDCIVSSFFYMREDLHRKLGQVKENWIPFHYFEWAVKFINNQGVTFSVKSLKEDIFGSDPLIPTWHSYMRKDFGTFGCLFFHL